MSAIRFGRSWPIALLALAAIIAVGAAVAIPAAPSFGESRTGDHIGNFNFRVEIDGVDAGGFTEVSGLKVEQDVIEFREGSDSTGVIRKLPGRVKYGDITLKRGYVPSGPMTEWVEASLTGPDADASSARRNGSIVIYDTSFNEIARYNFTNGWPSKWDVFSGEGTARDVLTEQITIVVEHIERAR